ncbi:MAG: hypothetical protein NAOJABEB_03135 [Steroidobacteraceae bacterium]|nr:hypothetical protein [Steroidobacteraceae bacterium]
MHEKSGAHVTQVVLRHSAVDCEELATLHEPSADGKHGNHEQWPNV